MYLRPRVVGGVAYFAIERQECCKFLICKYFIEIEEC